MTDIAAQKIATEQLRLKLAGKPLVGFDTRTWAVLGYDSSARARVGDKRGKVGGKAAPVRA